MVLILVLNIIVLIPLDYHLINLQIEAIYFELKNTDGQSTSLCMESTGNDSSGDSPEDNKGKVFASESEPEDKKGKGVASEPESGSSGTSPTNSESTGGLANLNDQCERNKELYDNAQERLKTAMNKGDLESAAQAARDIGSNKKSYFSNLEQLNRSEDASGLPRTDSRIKEIVTSKNESSDDEYFAKSDDSRPTTPGELKKDF